MSFWVLLHDKAVTVALCVTAVQTPDFTLIAYVWLVPTVAGAVLEIEAAVEPVRVFPFFVHAMLLLVPPITVAVKVIGLLIHSDTSSTLTVACSTTTVTFIVSIKLVAVFVPVIVNANVPAVVGVNVGFKILVLLNPVAGLHEIPLYVFVFA